MPPEGLPWRNISWKVIEECNYRCSYCLQDAYTYDYPRNIEHYVDCINQSVGEKCEIKIAGGEIFYNFEMVSRLTRALVQYGHWLSICTNLSATAEEYTGFLEMTEGKFYTFGASLHLEYADSFQFLEKCKRIRSALPTYSKIQVHNVITRGVDAIKRLGELKKSFEDEGIIFYTDLLVDSLGRYITYSDEENELIVKYLDAESKLIRHKGKPCRAGDSYIALLPNLDAWMCWDACLANEKSMYLGNMLAGTCQLTSNVTICPFETCSCPTPIFKHKYKLGETKTKDQN